MIITRPRDLPVESSDRVLKINLANYFPSGALFINVEQTREMTDRIHYQLVSHVTYMTFDLL